MVLVVLLLALVQEAGYSVEVWSQQMAQLSAPALERGKELTLSRVYQVKTFFRSSYYLVYFAPCSNLKGLVDPHPSIKSSFSQYIIAVRL